MRQWDPQNTELLYCPIKLKQWGQRLEPVSRATANASHSQVDFLMNF